MNTRDLRWRKSALIVALMCSVLGLLPALSAAQGLLETPQPGSFQSGVGLIRGWVCSATRIDIEVVDRGTFQAVYGEPRGDTQSTCGDANNGFSLQVNWNELGEGIHTIRALADNVEFGRAQVTVATLGQTYLQGAQGEFVVQPFPQSGKQARIRWQESRQLFVLSNGGTPSSGGGSPRADAKIEDPQPGSFQSGIGLVRGWVCSASRVDIELDGHVSFPAVYGEPRGDTQAACGDSNNGFSLQINWNDVGDGNHTVRALADGVEFGQATFTVVTLGLGSFPTGLVGNFTVANFPQTGLQTQVQWQESQQNFVVTGARFPGLDEGLCTTRNGQASDGSGGAADIAWGNPCLLSGNTAVLRVQSKNTAAALRDESGDREERAATGGAFFVCASQLTIQQGGQNFTASDFRLVDLTGSEVCRDIPPGGVLNILLQVNAQSELNFNAPFTILYNGQTLVDFPAATPSGIPKLTVSAGELTFSTSAASALSVDQPLILTETTAVNNSEERAQVGPSQDKSFTITNTGGGTLLGGMTLIANGAGGNVFSIISGAAVNLGAGQSQTVTVRFSPLSADPVIGSIRITTNGGVKRVLLRGGGQSGADPKVGASVTTLDFGNVQINTTPERSFTVTNNGGGTLTGSVDLTPNSLFAVIAGGTLNLGAGQSQTVTIRLIPQKAGQLNDQVTLNTNGGTSVVLLLANVVSQPRLSVNPGKLDFGTVQLPNSTNQTFTITNTGGGTLTGNVSVSNAGTSAPFSLISGGSFTLGANQSQTVTISFAPKSAGTFSGTADVSSNGGSASVSLSGTATQPPPTLSVTPTSINFGTLPNNQCNSQTSSFQVKNIGGGTLTGSVTTSLPFIINSPSSFSLGAGQSQTIGVTWRPTGTGKDSGSANISSNGGAGSVSLSGSCANILTITK